MKEDEINVMASMDRVFPNEYVPRSIGAQETPKMVVGAALKVGFLNHPDGA